jgi:hypothetical protein
MRMYYGLPGFLDRGMWTADLGYRFGLSIDPAQRELLFGVHDTRLRRVRHFWSAGNWHWRGIPLFQNLISRAV